MRRILVLLSVVALMVVLLATSVAPAYAKLQFWRCIDPDNGAITVAVGPHMKKQAKAFGFTECTIVKI
jgi:hypothetical protein